MDALILPILLGLIVIFFIGVWMTWLKDVDGRALRIDDDEGEDEPSSP